MNLSYADYTCNQEDAELAPNELAFYLSRTTAHDHFRIHRALLHLNPVVYIEQGRPCLLPGDASQVLLQAERDLLGGAGFCSVCNSGSATPYQLAA